MSVKQIIEADLAWVNGAFRPARIEIDDCGVIVGVNQTKKPPTKTLTGRAMLPGMCNVHSHAFQRSLRGGAQSFKDVRGSFWSWRDEMYKLVESLTPDSFYQACLHAFGEMLRSGITSVGEFHYLHHDKSGENYVFDETLLRAAKDVGIRVCLINAYYATGGIGKPLISVQQRFGSANVDEFLAQIDHLEGVCDKDTQSVGIAAHSIRAVLLKDMVDLHAEAKRRGLPMHVHVEEQQREIDQCIDAYGARPLTLINDKLDVGPEITAIHCTYSTNEDLERFGKAGAKVCICPITEADLGDGIADVPAMRRHGIGICLGSDSNVRIDFFEEQRWLEYAQRLNLKQRGVFLSDNGGVAETVFDVATVNGARSLGINAGAIEAGRVADFFTIDLTADCLEGCKPSLLLPSVIFGSGREAVREVCVGGRWIDA